MNDIVLNKHAISSISIRLRNGREQLSPQCQPQLQFNPTMACVESLNATAKMFINLVATHWGIPIETLQQCSSAASKSFSAEVSPTTSHLREKMREQIGRNGGSESVSDTEITSPFDDARSVSDSSVKDIDISEYYK